MLIVHHLEDSRSQRVLWLLEALGVAYEVKRYERDPETRLAPKELYEVHPLGKSPVVQDGDIVVAETGAIFEYILHTYDSDHRLHAPQDTEDRRALTYWLHYAEGSAMTPLLMKLVFTVMPERAPRLMRGLVKRVTQPAMASFVDPRLTEHAEYWNSQLGKTGWFAGSLFSAADIMMSFVLEAASSRMDMSAYPNITDFINRCHQMESYQAALETGGPYAYA